MKKTTVDGFFQISFEKNPIKTVSKNRFLLAGFYSFANPASVGAKSNRSECIRDNPIQSIETGPTETMLGVLADSIPRILDQGWTFFFADNRLILCRFSIDECFDGGGLVTEERDQTNDDAGDDVGRDLNFNVTLKTLIQINGDDEDGEGILRIVVYKRGGEGKESIGRRGRGGRFGHDTLSSCRKDIDGGRNSHRMRFVKEEFSTSRERFDVERLAYLMKLEVASEANPGNESKRKLKKRRRRAKTTKRGSEVNGDCLKVNHDGSDGHFDEDGAEDESSGRISVKEDRLNSDGHFDGDDDDKDELICRSRSPLSISRDDGEDVALQGIQTGRVISELPSDSFSPNPSLGDAKDFSVSHADSSFSLVSLDGVDEGKVKVSALCSTCRCKVISLNRSY